MRALQGVGEEGFFGLEFTGVDAAAEAAHFYGMLEVEHLVVEQVFEGVAGLEGRSKTLLTTMVLWAAS